MPIDQYMASGGSWVRMRSGVVVAAGTPPTPPSVTTVTSGVWAAGFQNAMDKANTALHPAGLVICGGDVAGVHLSTDSGDTWRPNNIGLTTVASLRCGGIRWSGTVASKVWYYSTSQTGSGSGIIWYGTYDASIGGIVKWNQLCTVPSSVEGGLDLHPRQAKRATIALDEANDLLYVATIDGIYRITISTGAVVRATLAGVKVTSIYLDPQDRTIMFATGEGTGIYRITAINGTPVTALRNPTNYLNAQSCVPVVESAVTVLYAVTGRAQRSSTSADAVVRWNGTAFTTAGNWSDITNNLNADETVVDNLWAGIDAQRVSTITRIIVTHSSDAAGNPSGKKVAWTDYTSGSPTWTKIGTADYRMNDATGATWWLSTLSPSLMADRNYDSTCPIIDPNTPTRLWLAGRSGIWRSINTGTTWFPAFKGSAVTTAWHILTKPNNNSKVITADTDWGALFSNDGFVTQPITPVNRPTTDVGWMNDIRTDSSRVICCMGDRDVNGNGAVYSNADPWNTASAWTDESHSGTSQPWTNFASTPRCIGGAVNTDGAGTNVILAAHQVAAGLSGLRRKVGLGAAGTWSTPTTGGVTVTAVAGSQRVHFAWPADGVNVWMLDPSTGVWQSRDRGVTWTRRQTFSTTQPYVCHIKASLSETGVYYFTRPNQVWKITAGDTASPVLTQIGASNIVQPSAIGVNPTNGKIVVSENGDSPIGGTLWLSTDGGTTFTDVTVPSYETICTTVKQMHWCADNTLYIAMYAGYSKTTGL